MAKANDAKGGKAPSKTEVLTNIATATNLSKKDVSAVFDALSEEIKKALGPRGPGVFQVPGLVKIQKKKVPAKPAEKNVLNRFTGETYDRPAKPASTKVTVRALKNLKSMA
jgi:nucleoid DNA-binding protein